MSAEPAALDKDVAYRALRTRDARFDGRFYTAVVSTGIYCRPICPARTPKLENCLFLPSAAAAHRLGFRPCLRCRPEVAPGLAGWRGSANTVSRALGLIAEGGFDEGGVDALADRLGVGSRHLRRLFDRHVGATPISVAQAHRLLFAKKLVTETGLGMAEIALASGFGSVRRFNDAFRRAYDRPPTALRRGAPANDSDLVLQLPFAPPYSWETMLDFLGGRAIPGLERVEDGVYHRSFEVDGTTGTAAVRLGQGSLVATIRISDVSKLAAVVVRLRRVFDLDADSVAIDAHLGADPALRRRVKARPGVRVPGAWDPFELAVRAVLGQQISVSAARTLAGRLARDGRFPSPDEIAALDPGAIGLTRARAATLSSLAKTALADPRTLTARGTLDDTVTRLCAIPGIGPWTAQYICMRALREPDAFPAADLGLLRALETRKRRPSSRELEARAEAWRPWRAYAALRLWTQP